MERTRIRDGRLSALAAISPRPRDAAGQPRPSGEKVHIPLSHTISQDCTEEHKMYARRLCALDDGNRDQYRKRSFNREFEDGDGTFDPKRRNLWPGNSAHDSAAIPGKIASVLKGSDSNKSSATASRQTTTTSVPPHTAATSSNRGDLTPVVAPAAKGKWSPDEDALLIELRASGMKWDDISKRLPGRSAISCRLHYQNFLERRSEWDEERKNKLARLYERQDLLRQLLTLSLTPRLGSNPKCGPR